MNREMIISPSLLGYEDNLQEHIEHILAMIDAGIEWLHIDVMRPEFVQRTAFSDEKIAQLYRSFHGAVKFDFHVMASVPDDVIDTIEKLVPNDRENTLITIHREAYRTENVPHFYVAKEHDLLTVESGYATLDHELREANERTGRFVYERLQAIKNAGFKTGLALEPNTSLDNITEDMAKVIDLLLLMSVHSGKGGQSYIEDVTGKILQAQKYNKEVQVDGGINQITLPTAIAVGAANIVIGSYITGAKDVGARVREIMQYGQSSNSWIKPSIDLYFST